MITALNNFAIKARSFGEIAVVDWKDYYSYTFEIHPACVCNTDAVRDEYNGTNGSQKSTENTQNDIQSMEDKDYTLSAYPNPFSDAVQLRLDNVSNLNMEQVQVYDITGRMIHIENNISNSRTTIQLSGLSTGIYFVRVSLSNEETKVTRVLKQ